jgi:hypothetical protein
MPALNIDAVEKEHVKVQQGTDCFNEAGFVDPVVTDLARLLRIHDHKELG